MYGVFLIAIVIAVLLVWRTMTWLIKILNLKKLNYSLFEYQMPETELQGMVHLVVKKETKRLFCF